ncbi:MAG: TolB family protein [Acidobacteriota bacterium]
MRILAIAALAAAACGDHHARSDAGEYGSLDVEPQLANLSVPLGGTATQDYQVFGVDAKGHKTDLTATCALTVDPTFGQFAQATLTAGPHGGKTLVTATCGTSTGSAELVVNVSGSIVVAGAPANAPQLFGGATGSSDPAHVPPIEYPLDHAMSPRNIPPIEIQWAAMGNDLFHVALASSFVAVDVYTTDVQAMLSEVDWDSIAGSAAGDSLAITVEGLVQAAPQTKYAGAPVTVGMSVDVIDKSAIYWWASSQGNIMDQTFGSTGAPSIVKGGCTSCHSVSRTASRIGYSRCIANNCGNLYAGFLHYDRNAQQWSEAVNADNMTIHGSYTTFAPLGYPFADDSQSLAIVSMANGWLELYDPDTGMPVASNIDAVINNNAGSQLMADWSPDGRRVVFTTTPNANQWIDLSGGTIVESQYTYTGGMHVFGPPQVIVPNPQTLSNGTYTNFFFPSFSPDGQLIVLDAARSAWRDSNGAKAVGSRLMLADAAGAWVTDLTAMNGGFVDYDTTWAHWAPTASSDFYWIVFSSERDYGHELTAANTNPACKNVGVTQCKQIWIGAIARNKLTGAIDPSFAPMWLPGQDTQADNISPYWSVPAGLQ